MNFRAIISKIVILIFSVFVLFSITEAAFGYFDLLSFDQPETIDLGEWPVGTPIYTAQEFYDFATSSSSVSTDRYYLANDIDFSGFTWDYNSTFNSNTFRGVFDGYNFTMSNLTISSTDTSSIGLSIFTKMNGATIKNVKIDNFKMGFTLAYFNATSLESAIFVSDVLGANNLVENITINNAEVIGNSLDGAGGLITSVRGDADLIVRNVKVTNMTVINTSKRAGGIICRIFSGSGVIIIEDVDFQGFVAADNRTSNTGGILGTAQAADISITRAVVEYTSEGTVNLTDGTKTIRSDRYSGGFVGNNNASLLKITDSFYNGTLFENVKYLGSAVGREKVSLTLINSFYSNVTFNNSNIAPTNTTGLHSTLVNQSSMPSISWWNNFALSYTSVNSLWTQDATGRLVLIR